MESDDENMSDDEKIEIVEITNTTMQTQIKGLSKTVEDIEIIIKIPNMEKIKDYNKILIQITLQIDGQEYSLTQVRTTSDLSPDGIVNVGTLYLMGPLHDDNITSSIKIYNLTEPTGGGDSE